MNGEAMIENEPGCEGARHENRNPRSMQKNMSAESTAEKISYQAIAL
jgi:hypothetical protein